MRFPKSQHFERIIESDNLWDLKLDGILIYEDLSQKNTHELLKSRDLSNLLSKSREKNIPL